ncbi:LysM peptidoglycan-binding domain-containing protein [Pseudobacteriovorax antillogorgiicola]|uniref:LysM domain-containing protein n=1 Tax=Pseudobacteriovorax antillogorgiicola TaxID=1513793 RepID=A0A1Y6C534_9BACT|nr:LysM peptidoglycan-binding domain-containing protein [Pseudobacteriovorax antillogorgiicola]TCS49474.1 LysM domain-containing protein [Pseudobacteriovorax antillogorgiicola]SMF46209.1 LysM domain-containing protein [Pseudobacteriovorax antillogorgiicola]
MAKLIIFPLLLLITTHELMGQNQEINVGELDNLEQGFDDDQQFQNQQEGQDQFQNQQQEQFQNQGNGFENNGPINFGNQANFGDGNPLNFGVENGSQGNNLNFGNGDDFPDNSPAQAASEQGAMDEGFNQEMSEQNFLNNSLNQPADQMNMNTNNTMMNNPALDMEDVATSESPMNQATPFRLRGPLIKKVTEPNLFSGAPPLPGTMRQMAVGEAPEEYPVEVGDTLFDICDQLIDEPGYWPKLWALNPYIRNPHFIYPGMKLRFYPGDESNPPFLRVVTEDDVVPVDRGAIVEDELLAEDVTPLLTKAEKPNRTPVISPDELREFPELDEAFIREGDVFRTDHQKVIIPAFVFEEEQKALATIRGGTAGSFLLDKGQDIVIEKEEGVEVGATLSVIRPSGAVINPATEERVGYRYEFVGHIRVFRQFPDDEDLYGAKVVFNRTGIRPMDLVVPFLSVKRKVPYDLQSREAGDHLVVGFDFPYSFLGGRGSFIFLEQKNGKLEVGDTIKLFQDVRKASLGSEAKNLPLFQKFVAEAHIVDNRGTAATAFVIRDMFEVRLGDSTKSQVLEQ